VDRIRRKIAGPTSQDAETPSYYGLNPFCYIVNARGGTRSDSEFRRPEMWALDMCCIDVLDLNVRMLTQ
jgi:hypothetical protein